MSLTTAEIRSCPLGMTPIIGIPSSEALDSSHFIQSLYEAYIPAMPRTISDAAILSAIRRLMYYVFDEYIGSVGGNSVNVTLK